MPKLIFPENLSAKEFLATYWQKKPLLMRQALPDYHFPLPAEELAGLSCEADVESRLVIEQGASPWELRHGPFSDEVFSALPEDHWTLLVQDADKYIPEVADLRSAFQFIPDWRADDIMISYAEDGGSVGPHTDTYDVFLIQAEGKRRWQISTEDFTNAELMADLSVRVLNEFKPQQEWTLEQGDVLYLPPGVAHWGIADGACMTYSMGYRAPSEREMLDEFSQFLLERIPEHLHYLDPPLELQKNPGEIQHRARKQACNRLAHWLTDEALQQQWFGCFVTEIKEHLPIYPTDEPLDSDVFKQQVLKHPSIQRHPFARFAFSRISQGGSYFFACGKCFQLSDKQQLLAEQLAGKNFLNIDEVKVLIQSRENLDFLCTLYNQGYLEFTHE